MCDSLMRERFCTVGIIHTKTKWYKVDMRHLLLPHVKTFTCIYNPFNYVLKILSDIYSFQVYEYHSPEAPVRQTVNQSHQEMKSTFFSNAKWDTTCGLVCNSLVACNLKFYAKCWLLSFQHLTCLGGQCKPLPWFFLKILSTILASPPVRNYNSNVIMLFNSHSQLLSAPRMWVSRALLHLLVRTVGHYHALDLCCHGYKKQTCNIPVLATKGKIVV